MASPYGSTNGSTNGSSNGSANGSTNGSSMNGSHTVSPFLSQNGLEAPPPELHLMSDPRECAHSADHATHSDAGDAAQAEANSVAAERRRLEGDIAAAKRRAASSQQRIEAAELDIREALRAELSASKDALAAIERQHEVTVAMIRSAAQAEVQRIMTEARRAVADGDPSLSNMSRSNVVLQNDLRQAGFSNAE